jgi:hypothetical protein
MKKDHNLSNPNSEPAHAELDVQCTVHLDLYRGKFPRTKMIEWLESIPEDANITFSGWAQGKPHFTAFWKESR